MTLEQLKALLQKHNNGVMDRTWDSKQGFSYTNEYISAVAIDSSNNWVSKDEMIKMWSIIFKMKKAIHFLPKYKELQKILSIDITPVRKGQNKGCYGIRIYNVKQEPNADIVKNILDFIFQ